MWIYSNCGVFSVVRKPNTDHLTIRARVAADLDRLRERWLPELGPLVASDDTDYPYRSVCTHAQFALALSRMAMAIDYSNVKSEVQRELGPAYYQVYHDVHAATCELTKLVKPMVMSKPPRDAKLAYGGVVIDEMGRRVLLREVANHFDGYVWSFAKGKANNGESPQDAALREVREELGVEAEILKPIAGWFRGHTSWSSFYLMRCMEDHHDFGRETSRVAWVGWDEARRLLAQSKPECAERDRAILSAAETAVAAGRR